MIPKPKPFEPIVPLHEKQCQQADPALWAAFCAYYRAHYRTTEVWRAPLWRVSDCREWIVKYGPSWHYRNGAYDETPPPGHPGLGERRWVM